jgi:acyl-CoA reductase-like NAD-dependent aldehyde dehydrogenase
MTSTVVIGGVERTTATTFEVVNPATGTPVGRAPSIDHEDLDDAMRAAAGAQLAWAADDACRRQALRAAAQELRGEVEAIAPVLTQEQGKPLREARQEVLSTALWCEYYADLDLPQAVIQDDDRALVEVFRRPLGVVSAITPWNFPLTLAAWKIAPALAAGNAVVLKPSPFTPLSTLAMGRVFDRVLPPGILTVVTGADELGAWMTEHPTPRKVSFTGSIPTGKLVARSAAADLKRVTLELGGNDPAILLDDVDVDSIADRLFWAAFRNCGQVCTAIKRVYVPARLHRRVADALADRARSVQVGDGMDDATELGPVNNRPQLERVQGLVRDALARGGRAVAGGQRLDGPGYFHAPTVVEGVEDGTPLVDDEQFGPALPVVTYRDVDDVVRRANGTRFGLSASVWSADTDAAARVATRIESGTTWVNAHLVVGPGQPFGGTKWSGVGVENGPWAIDEFTDLHVRHVARP